jgi:hypothetical protein
MLEERYFLAIQRTARSVALGRRSPHVNRSRRAPLATITLVLPALPGSLRHPLSGRDPQEGDDDDRDSKLPVGSVSAGVDACRANASAMRCCACCGVRSYGGRRG